MNQTLSNIIYEKVANESFNTKLKIYLFIKFIYGELNSGKINIPSFNAFQINDIYLKEYIHKYIAKNSEHRINGIPLDTICKMKKQWKLENKHLIINIKADYIKNSFRTKIFSRNLFNDFINSNKDCGYCGMSENELKQLIELNKFYGKNCYKEWKFEIARKNEYYEHSVKNSIVCCNFCKDAKNEHFTHEEFIVIGKSIREIWNQRLDKKPEKKVMFAY